jgi:hypothetical protein
MKRLPRLPRLPAQTRQERGPVSADQRQRWRHFSTTPVGLRGAFHVLSCCRDSPVIHSVQFHFHFHFHFHLTSFQSHLSKIAVASYILHFRVSSNLKGAIVRNANQILTLATAPPASHARLLGNNQHLLSLAQMSPPPQLLNREVSFH